MANGTVEFYNDEKGYGFIETDDADDDVFFHVTDVPGPDPKKATSYNSS
jgi:CspA family cold shock protein